MPAASPLPGRHTAPPLNNPTPVTIAAGGTTSDEVDLAGFTAVGLFLPAAFTGTAITFLAATESNGTFVAVYATGGGSAYSVTVGTSRYVPLDPTTLLGVRFLKLVSGSTEPSARTVQIARRPV